jgi:hypothetical protein
MPLGKYMTPTEQLNEAIRRYEGVTWSKLGEPQSDASDKNGVSPAWVKFGLAKSELGWRTLEFLAWAFEDMVRSKKRLFFWPTANSPAHNEPGQMLSFVVECYIDNLEDQGSIHEIANILGRFYEEYWPSCNTNANEA